MFKRSISVLVLLASTVAAAASRPYVPPVCPPSPAGFYVAGPQLFRADGTQLKIAGSNSVHWDNWGGAPSVANTGANVHRLAIDFRRTQAQNQALVDTYVAANVVPIVGNWAGTCSSDPAVLTSIVDTWVAQAPTWATHFANTAIINIANEWGPSNSTVWRDSYITAVQRMRAAGYTQTLVVDSGYCGQDVQDVVKYGAAVLAADPQSNVMFDLHVYASFHYPATASWMQDYAKSMAALKATGLPILLGEFGPAPFTTADGVVHTVGPSPTAVPTATLIADADANGFGWLAWAMDDNNGSNCTSSDIGGFSMTLVCGRYSGVDTDLTAFGRLLVPIIKTHTGR